MTIADTPIDRLKRNIFATTAPSKAAQPSFYEAEQRLPSKRILDDRPTMDADIAPISLLYPGFGDFLDIINGRTDVPGINEVDAGALEAAVDAFATVMCDFHALESGRKQAVLPHLDKIFFAHSSRIIPRIFASTIGTVHSDGHTEGRHGGMAMVEELKNRDTGNSSSAPVQMVGYVSHSHLKWMEGNEAIFEGWRVPCLGLTLVGEFMYRAFRHFYLNLMFKDRMSSSMGLLS